MGIGCWIKLEIGADFVYKKTRNVGIKGERSGDLLKM